jgi:hypothetical protein
MCQTKGGENHGKKDDSHFSPRKGCLE